jgi:ABC-type uncharacterized transport system permease subunit
MAPAKQEAAPSTSKLVSGGRVVIVACCLLFFALLVFLSAFEVVSYDPLLQILSLGDSILNRRHVVVVVIVVVAYVGYIMRTTCRRRNMRHITH